MREIERLRAALAAAEAHSRAAVQAARAASAEEHFRLAAERDHYAELYEQAPMAYAILDRHGLITDLNLAGCELLGETRESLIGRPLLVFAAEGSRGTFLEHMRRCRQGTSVVVSELDLHNRQRGNVPVLLSSSLHLGADSAPALFRTALIDISERRHFQEMLRRTERLASLGTFAAGMAHELNNPLNTILMAAQVALSDSPEVGSGQREALEEIVHDAQRCARVIKGMLRSARAETEKRLLDLNVVARAAVRLAKQYHHGLEVRLELAEHLPPVLGDATELEQSLLNLIRNAVEACGEPCRIHVRSAQAGNRVRLVVSDPGPGVPPEQLPHVFDPFFSTKRSHGGTGLGLSVVHAVMREHDGEVRVESRPGQGATFTLDFPAAPAERERESEHGANPGRG